MTVSQQRRYSTAAPQLSRPTCKCGTPGCVTLQVGFSCGCCRAALSETLVGVTEVYSVILTPYPSTSVLLSHTGGWSQVPPESQHTRPRGARAARHGCCTSAMACSITPSRAGAASRIAASSEKGVRLAQKMQVGPCIPVGIQLQKVGVGPSFGPTWRLSHLPIGVSSRQVEHCRH